MRAIPGPQRGDEDQASHLCQVFGTANILYYFEVTSFVCFPFWPRLGSREGPTLGHCEGGKRWHEASPGDQGSKSRKSPVGKPTRYMQGQKQAPKERWELGRQGPGVHMAGKREGHQGTRCSLTPPLGPATGLLKVPGSAEPAREEEDTDVEGIY